jgi:hemoglobin
MTIICTDQLTPPVNDVTGHAKTEEASLYHAIGGRRSLVAAVENFYSRLLADPEIVPFFPEGVTARHRAYLVTVLGEALGGPERYRGPDLTEAHRHLRITDHHFNLVAAHLDATLEHLGVPRNLTDQIIAIVATLHPVVVSA